MRKCLLIAGFLLSSCAHDDFDESTVMCEVTQSTSTGSEICSCTQPGYEPREGRASTCPERLECCIETLDERNNGTHEFRCSCTHELAGKCESRLEIQRHRIPDAVAVESCGPYTSPGFLYDETPVE